MPRIALQNLRQAYPKPGNRGEVVALDGVTLDVADGELLTVLGPSGSGKTTLLRLIAGLDPITGGCLRFDDRDMAGVAPERRGVGLVFQRGALFPHLSAGENLALGLRLSRLPRTEVAARVADVAGRLGIEGFLERMPGTLSAGERQRVALGRALATRPSVLLLDEPLAALDAPLRVQLRREIVQLHRGGGLTILHVTHDQDEALNVGQRVAVLRAGSLQQVDEPGALVALPANVFVAGFVGSPPMNLIAGRLVRGQAGVGFVADSQEPEAMEAALPVEVAERLASQLDRGVVLGMRVEDVRASRGEPPSGGLGFDAIVEALEMAGGRWLAALRCGGQRLLASTAGLDGMRPGQLAIATLDIRRACWFEAATGRRLWP